jgi:DNA-directed RNA polymerase subunit K/omega
VVLSPPQVDKKFEQRQQFTVRDLDQCDSKSEIGKVVCDASNGEINTEIDNSALAFPVFAVLSRLEISPKDVKIEPDERLTFSIKGLDQYGHEIEIRKVNWMCSTGGRIDRKGLFIGGYNKRQVTVTATVGEVTHSTQVTLLPVLKRLEISPKGVKLEPGESQIFKIIGFDQHGDEIEIRKVAWSATGGKINSNGTFIASSETGYFTVAAIVGAFKSVASVTIAAQESLDDHYDDISTDFDGEEDTNLGGSTCDYLNDEYSNSDDDQNTDVSNEGDTNDSGEEDTDDGGKGGDTAPQPRSHTKRKTFVADRDQILQLAVELLDVYPNRYRLVINVAHRARQIFYQNHNTTEKTAVLRAIKEMAEELSQPEIIGD